MVTMHGRCLAVPPSLGRALLPLHGRRPDEAAVRACLSDDQKAVSPDQAAALATMLCGAPTSRSRRRALWLRIPLIPRRVVSPIASGLCGLTSWPALVGLATFGTIGYLGLGRILGELPDAVSPAPTALLNLLPALALFLVTALWHELGHAAALSKEGYPPGGIGAGLLFVVPVLFADVTSIGALRRSGRARVDIAGVCFQLGLGGLLFAMGSLIPGARTAGLLALIAVAWSLLPFIRSDGYWLLCDLLQVSGLRGPLPTGRSLRLTLFLRLFRLANTAFLILVVALMARRVAGFIGQMLSI